MEFRKRRLLSFIIVGGYLFLGGCEFAVILPTVWDYLQSLGAVQEHWLGYMISGYSLFAVISAAVGGRLSDKFGSYTKTIVVICIFTMALGNFQYTLGHSIWNILAARCLCGFGTAAQSCLLAEVCRITEPEERTPILAICNAARQLGILIGPAFQLLLSGLHINLWDFLIITPLNAPGALMLTLWTTFGLLTLILFQNLADEYKAIQRQELLDNLRPAIMEELEESDESHESHDLNVPVQIQQNQPLPISVIPSYRRENLMPVHTWQESGYQPSEISMQVHNRLHRVSVSERFISSLARSGARPRGRTRTLTQTSIDDDMTAQHESFISSMRRYQDELFQDTIIVLLSMVFAMYFCEIGIEALIPVMMQEYFGYGEFENSLVFMAGGLEALIAFFIVAYLSGKVRETTLLTLGWILMILPQIWLMVMIPHFEKGNTFHFIIYLAGVFVSYLGYPMASAANTGLYSKCLTSETQGLGQGLTTVSSYLGLIFGPTWAGSTVRMPYVYLGVPIFLMLFNAVMFAFSFKTLRKLENKTRDDNEDSRGLLFGH